MIIWIASYPKSGNTWVRSIISSLIYSSSGIFNFNLLKNIKQFPNKVHFENLTDKFQDVQELKKFWVAAQERINLDKKIKFFKTHHLNCKIQEYPFTNRDNTLATIYIVRDPRNLVNSFTNHYTVDKDTAKEQIISPKFVTGAVYKQNKQNNVFTILGSWKDHYNSWTKKNDNLLLLKYEDLLLDPNKEINKIIKFIKNYLSFDYDDDKITNIINSTSFESMQKMEIENGFHEAVQNKIDKNKVNFFNLGKNNNWEKYLEKSDIEYLVNKLGSEMEELEYI
tara:strand:+ start:1851 stop:2693 length:843 start_codon:yes stop_codon:yes gene_type:complete